MGSKTKTVETSLQCPECDSIYQIHRKKAKQKERFHLKKFYCPTCFMEQNMVEVKDDAYIPDFWEEFQAQFQEER